MASNKRPASATDSEEYQGFIHGLSPIKISRTNSKFFDFTLQINTSNYKRVVCFDASKRPIIDSAAKGKSPLKLSNYTESPSRTTTGTDIILNKKTVVQTARKLKFLNHQPETQSTTPTRNLTEVQALPVKSIAVPNRLMNAFEEARQLNSDHGKKYMEKLRSINPPCVPFLGMYLTNILKIEEGNLDFLPNRPPGLINFSKRRKVAEITGEIQQYQNQPYCLSIQPEIREYFESLNPREELSEKEFNDYLYEKSLDIEPRNCTRPPKFARKTEFPLKSPGIRPITAKHLTQKHASFPFNATFGSMREDAADIEASSPHNTTPSTPTTPLSPPHNGDNVFLPVTIGQGIDHSTNPSQNNEFPENELPMDGLIQPPPLPPRRKNRDSEDGSPRIDNAPEIPPRGLPPPVPPRKDSMFGSLTRCQSVSQQQPTRHLSGHFQNLNATLPRCSAMERDRPTIPINFNGEENISLTTTPKLPPKTYKHIRQQSS